jgi:hypothetical protein
MRTARFPSWVTDSAFTSCSSRPAADSIVCWGCDSAVVGSSSSAALNASTRRSRHSPRGGRRTDGCRAGASGDALQASRRDPLLIASSSSFVAGRRRAWYVPPIWTHQESVSFASTSAAPSGKARERSAISAGTSGCSGFTRTKRARSRWYTTFSRPSDHARGVAAWNSLGSRIQSRRPDCWCRRASAANGALSLARLLATFYDRVDPTIHHPPQST